MSDCASLETVALHAGVQARPHQIISQPLLDPFNVRSEGSRSWPGAYIPTSEMWQGNNAFWASWPLGLMGANPIVPKAVSRLSFNSATSRYLYASRNFLSASPCATLSSRVLSDPSQNPLPMIGTSGVGTRSLNCQIPEILILKEFGAVAAEQSPYVRCGVLCGSLCGRVNHSRH